MIKDLNKLREYQKINSDCKKEATRILKHLKSKIFFATYLEYEKGDILQIRDLDFSHVSDDGEGDVSVVYYLYSMRNSCGFVGVQKVPFKYFYMTNKEISKYENEHYTF